MASLLQRHLELDLKIAEAITAWMQSHGIPGIEQMIRQRSTAKATVAHLGLLKGLVIIVNWINVSQLNRDDLRLRLRAIEAEYSEEENAEELRVLRSIINVLPRASESESPD